MPFVKMGRITDIPIDSVMEVFSGEQPYAICNSGGSIRALSGICIHAGGPLGQGQIHDGHVVCPYHLWEFDCDSGEYDLDPCKRVDTYQVKIEDGDILVLVP